MGVRIGARSISPSARRSGPGTEPGPWGDTKGG